MLTVLMFRYKAEEMTDIRKDDIMQELYNHYREVVAGSICFANYAIFKCF